MSTDSDEFLESMDDLEEQLLAAHAGPWLEMETPSSDTTEGEDYVSVGAVDEDVLPMLVEPDWAYWLWVRLAILRLLTQAYQTQTKQNGFGLHQVASQIGIENAKAALEGQGLSRFVGSLKVIAAAWAVEVDPTDKFPHRLRRNIDLVASDLGMNAVEMQVFGLAVLIHAEPLLEGAFDLFGAVRGNHVPRLLALALELDVKEVEKALAPEGLLARSGMLSVDLRSSGTLNTRLDLISQSFADRMVQEHADIFGLLQGLVERPEETHLEWSDYEHMNVQLEGLEDHLRHALRTRKRGVNVLFYGHAGTGKTQLARLLAKSLHSPIVSVSSTDQNLFPITAATRTKMFRLAQSVFGTSYTLLVLDECEEIFGASSTLLLDNSASPASKSWLIHALETNQVPTIWICNSIRDFEPAYIRRFDYCVRFDLPAAKYRRKHMQAKLGNYWSDAMVQQMAKHVGASPAMITRTAEIVSSAGAKDDKAYKGKLALQLLNQKLTALGYAEAQLTGEDHAAFKPEYVNAEVDLEMMALNLERLREGRICVYGPPGTGKTAFGHWLADKLSMPHLAYRASDLLAPHVGETEQQIAQAFARARADGAVLQFDEVDTFLAERQSSRQGWEASMVNEMLVQLETFQGIFIASTNILDRLDEASLRRFDLVVKFDALRGEHAQRLFLEMCDQLQLGGPSAQTLERLKNCNGLTPGDFHQQRRQAKFSPPTTSEELGQRLIDTSTRKHTYRKAPMGFTAVH